jgi:HPt (histidine-containing phosphotransfer) domain-containing protein
MPGADVVFVEGDLADLMPQFFANRALELARIRAALAGAEFSVVRRVAHGLKGVGGAYGFDEVSRLGAAIEMAAGAADASTIARLASELECYLANVNVSFI